MLSHDGVTGSEELLRASEGVRGGASEGESVGEGEREDASSWMTLGVRVRMRMGMQLASCK